MDDLDEAVPGVAVGGSSEMLRRKLVFAACASIAFTAS
jgi:hypothetical protein